MGEYPNNYFAKTSKSNIQAIGAKGGRVSSMKKKYAAKIRHMKERGLTNKDIDWFLQQITDPEANMIQIEESLDRLKDNMSEKDYLNLKLQAHSKRFGDKHVINSTNINITISDQEVNEHLINVFGKDIIDVTEDVKDDL